MKWRCGYEVLVKVPNGRQAARAQAAIDRCRVRSNVADDKAVLPLAIEEVEAAIFVPPRNAGDGVATTSSFASR